MLITANGRFRKIPNRLAEFQILNQESDSGVEPMPKTREEIVFNFYNSAEVIERVIFRVPHSTYQ